MAGLLKFTEYFNFQNHLDHFYIGTVVDNDDPLKKGRAKVTIPNFLDGQNLKKTRTEAEIKEVLPWINPLLEISNHGYRQAPPEIGDLLRISFPYEDCHFGMYDFYMNTTNNSLVHKNAAVFDENGNYKYILGEQDSLGTYYVVNKKDKYEKFHHVSGFEVLINKDGKYKINIPENWEVEITKKVDIHAEDIIKIKSDIEIELNGADLTSARQYDTTRHFCPYVFTFVDGFLVDGDPKVKHKSAFFP